MKKHLLLLLPALALSLAAGAQRLPDTVVPEHYQIRFALNLAEDDFAGDGIIRVRIKQPVSEITLPGVDIKFGEVVISSGSSTQAATVKCDATVRGQVREFFARHRVERRQERCSNRWNASATA